MTSDPDPAVTPQPEPRRSDSLIRTYDIHARLAAGPVADPVIAQEYDDRLWRRLF